MQMSLLARPAQWGALGLTLLTSTIIFARRVLVLNRLACPPRGLQPVAYGVSLVSGLLFWATLNATKGDEVGVQLLLGLQSTTLAWLVLVLLVNERLRFPTRQQWLGLVFYLVTETSILFQVRLVWNDGEA